LRQGAADDFQMILQKTFGGFFLAHGRNDKTAARRGDKRAPRKGMQAPAATSKNKFCRSGIGQSAPP
jgi:hypothetical protein